MKWLIASDIHGSSYYCKQLVEAFEREQADKLVLLGDLLYHGPRNDLPKDYEPKKVIEMLNTLKERIIAVRGNCDAEVDQMVLEFPIMADYVMLHMGNRTVYASHGHVVGPDQPLPFVDHPILVCGHTHVPVRKEYETFTFLNPGSVSIPKENSHHGYILMDEEEILFKDLEGNRITIQQHKKGCFHLISEVNGNSLICIYNKIAAESCDLVFIIICKRISLLIHLLTYRFHQ